MAPAKRGRPAFSPPRPGKAKTTTTKGRDKPPKNAAVTKKRASNVSDKRTPTSGRKRGRPSKVAADDDDDEEEDDSEGKGYNGRSALALVDMQAGEDDDDGSQDEVEEDEEEEEENSEEDTHISNNRNRNHNRTHQNSSPEPDMILAEITTTNEPSPSAIPERLVHRLLAHHFEKKEKTKISVDARDLVSKYLEVFVREAIMRSAFEKDERQMGDGGGGGVGFLEVEDLERAAVQLCLDF